LRSFNPSLCSSGNRWVILPSTPFNVFRLRPSQAQPTLCNYISPSLSDDRPSLQATRCTRLDPRYVEATLHTLPAAPVHDGVRGKEPSPAIRTHSPSYSGESLGLYVKLSLCLIKQMYRKMRYSSTHYSPRHLMVGQLHTTAALTSGKPLRYTLDRKLRGPKSPSRLYGEQKVLTPTGNGTSIPRSFKPWHGRYTGLSYTGRWTNWKQWDGECRGLFEDHVVGFTSME
jgi:hypothetical protein